MEIARWSEFIALALGIVFFCSLLAWYEDSRRKKAYISQYGRVVVYVSPGVNVIGTVCMAVFGALAIGYALSCRVNPPLKLLGGILILGIFLLFFFLGAFLCWFTVSWRLLADGQGIQYTPAFGKTQYIPYEELGYLAFKKDSILVFDHYGHRAFAIQSPCVNGDILLHMLQGKGVSTEENSTPTVWGKREKHYVNATQLPMPPSKKASKRTYTPPDLPENAEALLSARLNDAIALAPLNNPCAPGSSKAGGVPDLPAGFKWDTFAQGNEPKRPLTFLLQMDCHDLASCDPEGILPHEGLLSFFYELETMPWGPGDPYEGYFKVYYFEENQALTPTAPPAQSPLPERGIGFTKTQSAPDYFDFVKDLNLRSHISNNEIYDEMLSRRDIQSINQSQMLGYPGSIQGSVFDEFQCTALDASPDDWVLLLQLDSGFFAQMGVSQIMFGDAGTIYFGIQRADLQARRFDQVYHTLQCF